MAKKQSVKDDYIDIISNDPKLEKKLRKRRKKMRRTKKQKAVRAISITAIVICVLLVAYVFVTKTSFFGVQLPSIIGTPDEIKEKSVGFLICGIDYEEGTSRAHLSDVQMYVNYDVREGKINILQLPRDTYVTKEETATGKINAIYNRPESYGKNGIVGLAEYINKAYRLPVDYYATVTMTTFKEMIDKMGGVEVNVPQTFTLEGVTIEKGLQTLNGLQAEKFVRNRGKGQAVTQYYDGSDTKRQNMQRIFMAALAKKIKSLSVGELVGIITPALASKTITTNLTAEDALKYVKGMQKVDMNNMFIETPPGQSGNYNGQSVYSIHKDDFAELLNERFRPYGKKYSADELNVVELWNTTNYYENNGDDFTALLTDDYIPGQKKETSSAEKSSTEN